MKRIHLLVSAGLCIGIGAPVALVFAATFGGPPNCTTPPCNNVPGVIWNVAGNSTNQYGAQIDFGTPVPGTPFINLKSDLGFTTGKALRIDVNGNATFNVGNWGGAGGASKPLNFTVYGGARTMGISANQILGEDGRMQADKFCFNPGNPADCILSWPAAATGYVLKTGDTMTGQLTINTNEVGANYRGFLAETTVPNVSNAAGGGTAASGNTYSLSGGNTSYMTGVSGQSQISGGSTNVSSRGGQFSAVTNGNANATYNWGVWGSFTAQNITAGAITEGTGVYGQALNTDLGNINVTNLKGVSAVANGRATNLYGVDSDVIVGSTVTNVYGVNAEISATSGTVPSAYGVRSVLTKSGTGNITTAYGVYADASAIPSGAGGYFKGDGVGVLGYNNTPNSIGALAYGAYGGAFAGDLGIYVDAGIGSGVLSYARTVSTTAIEAVGEGFVENPTYDPFFTPSNLGSLGVYGVGHSYGVVGKGNTGGVVGYSSQPTGGSGGSGVSGYDYSGASGGVGVAGYSLSPSGVGVSALQQGANGVGVRGYATALTGKGGYFISNGIGSLSFGLSAGAIAIATTTLSSNPDTYWVPAAADGSGVYAKGPDYGVYAESPTYAGHFTMSNGQNWARLGYSGAGSYSYGQSYGAFGYSPNGIAVGAQSGYAAMYASNLSATVHDYFARGPWAIMAQGDITVTTTRGILLDPADRPLITRGFDKFTSGANVGLGRWGVFMEPNRLTLGFPNMAGKGVNISKYDVNGAKTDVWGIDDVGNMVVSIGNGYKPGGGSWAVWSDGRLKVSNGEFTKGLNELSKLDPIYYNYKKDNAKGLPTTKEYVGFIAQEVQQVIPEAVSTDEDGYLTVDNDPIIWTMLNSIKELKAQNDDLRSRIEALEAK